MLIIISVLMLGSVIAEFFSERKALKESIPKLIDSIQGKSMSEMKAIIFSSELLKRQKRASEILIDRIKYPDNTREALARQLLADEENRYSRITKITDIVARTAPMFGLMGTLIPLGPGLIALGQGDTKTLSDSLLIAFDTTVAGLISGAISYVISGIRKSWYEQYIIGLETVFEAILEEQSRERKKAYRRMQQQNSGSIKDRG
ncbi:MAG: MotA/TolQ/ExbB proton channel family protein [Firmicutes bacterium]|nr:MotA/TolQ/ExbB proton channel family protein [Bacillota bacterium]